jgi:hypothetical protein
MNGYGLNNISSYAHAPRVVNALIEIPKGRRSKFELDKRTGLFRLDRYLYSSSHYPGDYGFIPHTLAEDGDALDLLVMVNEPTFSGCLIESRIVGLFKMKDGGANHIIIDFSKAGNFAFWKRKPVQNRKRIIRRLKARPYNLTRINREDHNQMLELPGIYRSESIRFFTSE